MSYNSNVIEFPVMVHFKLHNCNRTGKFYLNKFTSQLFNVNPAPKTSKSRNESGINLACSRVSGRFIQTFSKKGNVFIDDANTNTYITRI